MGRPLASLLIAAASALLVASAGNTSPRRGTLPIPPVAVPTERQAIGLARVYLTVWFSDQHIATGEPFSAKLVGGRWIVRGYLPAEAVGGSFTVVIDQKKGSLIGMKQEQ